LVRAKLSHPQGPPNTFSKRRNQPLELPLRCSPPCTPQWTIATLTEPPFHKRLRRHWPNGLFTRF
jgi:hypothetical protein